uniref:XPG-I domain-containing protein n=1 Tax=Plectus sambesii TaxID=2011161 RepID=A0A914X4L6_9BILA
MDALTFGSTVLLRHMTFSEAKKMPIQEFHLDRVLSAFDMSMEQFIDLCIMLGCDYCGTIRGIGQKKAFELIKTHKTIEAVLKHIDKEKYPPPENWAFEQARKLFINPDVADPETIDLKWREPDEEALIQYMVTEKSFSEERIRSALQKLNKGRTSSTQGRIDSFFTSSKLITSAPTSAKRKALDEKNKGPAKKNSKGSGGSKMRAK